MAGIMSIEMLPVDCVSTILSLTSPSDAGKLSIVSSEFRSAAKSDVVWGRFLPKNYSQIVAESDISGESPFGSKREIFFRLCSPILIHGGKKSLELEKLTGKISYTMSARELDIKMSSDPLCWTWKSHPRSRFGEVAELRSVNWLEINGKIRTKTLSSNTMYGAYLLVKISERAYGLDLMPAHVSVHHLGNNIQQFQTSSNSNSKATVWLQQKHNKNKVNMECLFYGNRRERVRKILADHHVQTPEIIKSDLKERSDGWFEIELGQFFTAASTNDGDDQILNMSFMEIKGFQLKSGLIVEGIQIRPKH